MALLTAIRPTSAGVTWTGTAVAASDTISVNDLGTLGAYLVVVNGGGSPDTVAITDSGVTPAGTAGTSTGSAVTNATSKVFYVSPKQANLATGLVTVTHRFTTTVTCFLIPLG